MGPDLTATSSTGARNSNVIWITGEFFGVQRARDMLFQVSVNKVCLGVGRILAKGSLS